VCFYQFDHSMAGATFTVGARYVFDEKEKQGESITLN
jgi:hypothetical protein